MWWRWSSTGCCRSIGRSCCYTGTTSWRTSSASWISSINEDEAQGHADPAQHVECQASAAGAGAGAMIV
jgi:hypothetical protein